MYVGLSHKVLSIAKTLVTHAWKAINGGLINAALYTYVVANMVAMDLNQLIQECRHPVLASSNALIIFHRTSV